MEHENAQESLWLLNLNKNSHIIVATVYTLYYVKREELKVPKKKPITASGRRTTLNHGSREGLRHRIAAYIPDAWFMDGFDDCIVGVYTRFGEADCVAYDTTKVLEKLCRVHKMTMDEAIEYHEYNQLGAYVGEHTPAFLTTNEYL